MSNTDRLIAEARLAQGMTEEEAMRNREFTEWARSLRTAIKETAFIYGAGGLIIGATFPWLLGN
ncbi:MAG: hypothetical protein JJT87_12490 [Halomonas sp.]|nr:hypothetical protein [Halomonas sp.]MCC5902728.1 hypothetical protein [Halomonas sp.]